MDSRIRELPEGEKITESGFYRISLDRHHAQPCDGPSVTSGVLRQMDIATPADVWAFHLLNPDRWEKPETPSLKMGRAMAAYVEGGEEEVSKYYTTLPADKPRRPTMQQIEAYDAGRATEAGTASVEFWRGVEQDPRDYLTDIEWNLILTMGRVLAADPGAAAWMDGEPEITMAWRDEETGLWLLSRPDTVSFSGILTDYKKMNTMNRPFTYRLVDGRITQHRYDMQMAFACEVFERLTGEWPEAGIVAQWDAPPHHVILRPINDEDLRMGQWSNRCAIRRFAECLESGHWPGPGEDIGAYQRPEWQRQQIMEDMQIGAAL